MEKSNLASLVVSAIAASTICLAGASANAADAATSHFFGPGVFLGNMIKSGKTGPTVVPVDVEEKKRSVMAYAMVYNPSTCAEITSGAWTINVKPKHGTDSLGPYKFSFTCNGKKHTYTYAGIYYTSSGPASKAKKDVTLATWSAPGTTTTYYDEFKITITP